MRTLAVGFGLGLGVMASEVAYRLIRPLLGRPPPDRLQPRGLFSALAIVSGVVIMFLLDRAQIVDTADNSYWTIALLGYAGAMLWNLIVLVQRSWPESAAAQHLRRVSDSLNWMFLFGIGLAVFNAALSINGSRREEALLCLAAAAGAICVLAVRLLKVAKR
jgi:hypothetical protein